MSALTTTMSHCTSHGDVAGHTACLERLREAIKQTGMHCAVLLDTKVPPVSHTSCHTSCHTSYHISYHVTPHVTPHAMHHVSKCVLALTLTLVLPLTPSSHYPLYSVPRARRSVLALSTLNLGAR